MGYYNTKTIDIGSKKYCYYCGNEAINDYTWEHDCRYDYYSCNCDGSKAQIEYEIELYELNQKYTPRLKQDIERIKRLMDLNELEILKNRYKEIADRI